MMRRTRQRSSPSRGIRNPLAACGVCALLVGALVTAVYVSWQWLHGEANASLSNNALDQIYPMVVQGQAGGTVLQKALANVRGATRRKKANRLAIVLPFAGDGPESIPSYLSVFCVGAAAAQDTADFLIFHNGVLESFPVKSECPPNVRFINLGSTHAMAVRLLSVLNKTDEELAFSRERLEHLTATHLKMYPYCLVEFKPALGHIFADFLQDYSHWGYSDLDILFGDLGRWMTPDEWDDFDIVTYGFGDQKRLYVRGQFTFHKNTRHVNNIWRACDYLTNLDTRFFNVIQGTTKFQLESAEGCYSAAILSDDSLRVKYAVKAWTDIDEDDTAYTHGLFVAKSPQTAKLVIYKPDSVDSGKKVAELGPTWFEKDDRVYLDRNQPLQFYNGAKEVLALPDKTAKVNKCMYWVQDKYQSQLCLSEHVTSGETVFWIDGALYRQRHENVVLESGTQTAPFFHFQEWKRYFRSAQLTTLHMSTQVSTFVLAKEGAIPLPNKLGRISSRILPSPLGLAMKKWNAIADGDRSQLPGQSYCILSGPKLLPPQPPMRDCYHQVSWQDTERVEILSGAPSWKSADVETGVTLVLTLQVTESQATDTSTLSEMVALVVENLTRWQGQPCIVVIHVAGATEASSSFLRLRFGPNSELAFGLENALIVGIFRKDDDVVSRKALINMAVDAVPTRWYLTGVDLERGLSLSVDAAFFAHRAVQTHGSFQGHAFFIPQLALAEADSDVTLAELVVARHKREVKYADEYETLCDDETPERNEHANLAWWVQTNMLVQGETTKTTKEDIQGRTAALQELENRFLELLTDESHYTMYAIEESPILLVDNLGPQDGVRTSEIAREIEELGGRRCYNGLRVAQLAAYGYKFDVLAGAFAASSEASRMALSKGIDESLWGQSKCDGCIMFDEENEEILEAIVTDEIHRPAKTAILWEELLAHNA